MFKVPADYICEHGMPQPWVTCHECMFLPFDMRPVPPAPEPEPEPKPKRKRATPKRAGSTTQSKTTAGTKTKAGGKAKTKKRVRKTVTGLPKSVDDASPELTGNHDLAYEIPELNLQYHVQGADAVWLPISTMPTELRTNGWVYLKSDEELLARCRVTKVGFRDRRWTHEGSGKSFDSGPGPTLELDGDWNFMSVHLGPDLNNEIRGYRYLITDTDDKVRHYVA